MDVYSLLSIVKSYYRPDNYDLHIKLCMASKKYSEFTKNLEIDKYFNVTTEKRGDTTTHRVCGALHGLYRPALTYGYRIGVINYITYVYYHNNTRHRVDGPAIVVFGDNRTTYEKYYINDKLHRADGPAWLEYNNGCLIYEKYFINDRIHRTGGPALIKYCQNILSSEKYYIDGKLHCETGPAVKKYRDDGSLSRIEYYINGKIHRTEGPAITEYNMDNSIYSEQYYINNEIYGKHYHDILIQIITDE